MTKDELKEFKSIKIEVEQLKDKIVYLEELKTSVRSQVISGMPGGGQKMDIPTLLAKIEESQQELLQKQNSLVDKLMEIENCIEKLDSSTERCILRLRYIDCKPWEEICVDMSYSWRHIHRLHSKILDKIA